MEWTRKSNGIALPFASFSPLLHSILIDLWEVTLQSLQKALSNVPKKLSSRYLYKRMYNALQMLREFFHAGGNGVAEADLESEIYHVGEMCWWMSVEVCHCGWVGVIVDRGGWVDGWMDGWTDGRTHGQTDRRTDGWVVGWMFCGWMDGCLCG